MPQPEGNNRPRLEWWWDGSGHGEVWAWLLALAGAVVAFSLGALVTAGSSPIRGIALANLQSGLGVALLPTLIALRRLDRRQRLGEYGVLGHREVRRALHRSLATLGLVDEDRPPGPRRPRRLPQVRPASWYQILAGCWAGFVLLDLVAVWVAYNGLIAPRDSGGEQLRFAVDVIAMPALLVWLVVGIAVLLKALRVARWLSSRVDRGTTTGVTSSS